MIRAVEPLTTSRRQVSARRGAAPAAAQPRFGCETNLTTLNKHNIRADSKFSKQSGEAGPCRSGSSWRDGGSVRRGAAVAREMGDGSHRNIVRERLASDGAEQTER